MKMFILDAIHQDAVDYLKNAGDVEVVTWDSPEAAQWQGEADGVIVRGTPLPGDAIRAAKKLKVIGRHGAGYDKVDAAAVREKGIALFNAPFENSQSVVELTIGLMIAASRNLPLVQSEVKADNWVHAKNKLGGMELFENTVGFVGFGRIGRETARVLRAAFSMKVLAYDPFLPAEGWAALEHWVTPCGDVTELFASSDFISLHVPKTKDTLGLIGAAQFKAARKNLVLVNTARGGVVDEDALYGALKNGQIRAAASDVFAVEPLDSQAPLLTLPNFIATAHYGGSTTSSLRRVALAVARETHAFLNGGGDKAYRVI